MRGALWITPHKDYLGMRAAKRNAEKSVNAGTAHYRYINCDVESPYDVNYRLASWTSMSSPAKATSMEPEEDLVVENALLRQLLVEAGLHAAEQDVAGKLQRLISEELHHRVQNTLATVQAIVSQTLRTANSMEEAQGAIEQRLRSLGRVHDLLLRTSWVQANLRAILLAATQPFGINEGAQFVIDCPRNLAVAPGAALPTAMVLNELCTNATKYGALSEPGGRVHITAKADEGRKTAHLKWQETGGPIVKMPTRRSFGSRLIEQSLLADTRGKGRIQFLPSGVVCELEVALFEQTLAVGSNPSAS